jgi:hypothetical protein
MATTATITPTLGSAPVTLQAGNYSAIDDRRFWGAATREGVVSGGSYQVIQRAAGANMTVDVTSSVGLGAIVQGDSVTGQGEYFVPQTAANVNVDIAASDATNPRNDLVVLEVKDDQHDAGGLNLARVRVITGTPNGSAAATDAPGANGTPALPSSCLLLALVRVPAGVTSVLTAHINDRRPWAGGVATFETSLPSPAADGQEIYYRASSTAGVIWHLRYRNAFNGGNATYPWEFVGGSTLSALQAADVTNITSTSYVADANTPTITVPLAGDYDVTFSAAYLNQSNLSAQVNVTAATSAPSTGAGDALAAIFRQEVSSTPAVLTPAARTIRLTGLAASGSLQMYHRVTGGTGSAVSRSLVAVPVRVG